MHMKFVACSMGCISSKADINDLHPNLFTVMNVDDAGNVLSQGQLEVTETDLILYQRGKTPVRWPLRWLRRYGFDADVFSFESGRRCPTGPGIYAFRCSRAENLFNMLQTQIQQSRSNGGEDTISRDFAIATPTSAPAVLLPSLPAAGPRGSLVSSVTLVDSPLEPNYLEPLRSSRSITLRQGNGISRHSSGGPLSPQTPSSITAAPFNNAYYVNNDVVMAASLETAVNNNVQTVSSSVVTGENHVASEMPTTPATPTSPLVYMNLNSPTTPSTPYEIELAFPAFDAAMKSEHKHLYMNVEPDKEILELPSTDRDKHCYANLGLGEIESVKARCKANVVDSPPLAQEEEDIKAYRPINYIQLDLDGEKAEGGSSTNSTGADARVQRYITIDFDKTVALSHSANPPQEADTEGLRKTRHNSTVHELPVKQNSSSVSE